MPIAEELERVLSRAAKDAGIDTVRVMSGGQPGSTGRRIGSTRHDGGRAADLQLVKGGRTLTFTDQDCDPEIETFVTAAAVYGATGMGAGVHYMGPKTLHVGFGTSPQDDTRVVWGADGKSANAPKWLRDAARKGWAILDRAEIGAPDIQGPGRYEVIARGGLLLRKGPGLEFGNIKTVETGTEVAVVGFDGPNSEWARVDLEGDGLVDGYMFAAFLAPVDLGDEAAEEPNAGEA